MAGPYEIEIVCRGVILGNLAESAALEQSHRQIEAWRTILAFIITVGEKIENCRHQPTMTQSVDHRPINLRVAAPALFVGWTATISDHGEHEPVLDALTVVFIACEPRDCTNGAGGKQEPVAVARP